MKYKVLHKKEHPLITGGVPFCAIIRNGKNGGFFMYKVVIIDDEPIIVEGLSRLLPWEQYLCRITDVAEMVGFTDVAHFSRVFKKTEGISANEYRNTKL